MEIKTAIKYARIAPRKARLVADQIRRLKVDEAVNVLKFSNKKAAKLISGILKAGVASAKQLRSIDLDLLVIKAIYVNEGPTTKRFLPRAQGRATPLRHRTSHIHVVLDEEE